MAFNHINQCRRLPALLENFLDDLRANFYLIENETKEYMDRYELDNSPDHIQLLVARLMDWYKAWAPPIEFGSTVCSAYTSISKLASSPYFRHLSQRVSRTSVHVSLLLHLHLLKTPKKIPFPLTLLRLSRRFHTPIPVSTP